MLLCPREACSDRVSIPSMLERQQTRGLNSRTQRMI
jgi:hypothetical protein